MANAEISIQFWDREWDKRLDSPQGAHWMIIEHGGYRWVAMVTGQYLMPIADPYTTERESTFSAIRALEANSTPTHFTEA